METFIIFAVVLNGIIVGTMGMYYQFKMIEHRKPGVPLLGWGDSSPFRLLFIPSNLTPEGLRYRKRAWASMLMVLVPILVFACYALIKRIAV